MGNRWVAVLDRWLHEVAGLWGFLHLGCNRAALQVAAYSGFTVPLLPLITLIKTLYLTHPVTISSINKRSSSSLTYDHIIKLIKCRVVYGLCTAVVTSCDGI